jgi:hypothetical protein
MRPTSCYSWLHGIQTTAGARLVESLHAARCLIIRTATTNEKAKGFEYCRKGISASLMPATLQLDSSFVQSQGI